MTSYVFGRTVALPFDTAVQRITDELAKVGFGVLTKIDLQATMTLKLGLETGPYRILRACHPQFASRAIAAQPQIGALLPCNVVVRQDATGAGRIDIMDADAVLALVDDADIARLAAEVRASPQQALAAV